MIKFPKAPKLSGVELAVCFLETIEVRVFRVAVAQLSPERLQELGIKEIEEEPDKIAA